MRTANGLHLPMMRSFACRCLKCPVEISSTLMTSFISTSMEQGIMIDWWILPCSGVLRIMLKLKCLNINVIKCLISLINEQIYRSYSLLLCISNRVVFLNLIIF